MCTLGPSKTLKQWIMKINKWSLSTIVINITILFLTFSHTLRFSTWSYSLKPFRSRSTCGGIGMDPMLLESEGVVGVNEVDKHKNTRKSRGNTFFCKNHMFFFFSRCSKQTFKHKTNHFGMYRVYLLCTCRFRNLWCTYIMWLGWSNQKRPLNT